MFPWNKPQYIIFYMMLFSPILVLYITNNTSKEIVFLSFK